MYQWPRGSCLMKKTRGQKSRVRVPLTKDYPVVKFDKTNLIVLNSCRVTKEVDATSSEAQKFLKKTVSCSLYIPITRNNTYR
jgi:hypothetical protein